MLGLFESVFNLTEDIVKVAISPVVVAVDATRIITEPAAELAVDIVENLKNV